MDWVARGVEVRRGPDGEPLLAELQAMALLSANLFTKAEGRYRRNFDAGKGPEEP